MASYQVEVSTQARQELRHLPGNMRQRIFRAIKALADNLRPHNNRTLDLSKTDLQLAAEMTVHRLTIDSWRVVYVVEETWELILVLAIRKRPPYQYEDLGDLLEDIE